MLCNGKLKESAIVTCTVDIGWVGSADWLELDCRYKAIVVETNKTGNSTGNSTGNATTKTGVFRQNNGQTISKNHIFILSIVVYVLFVSNINLHVF